MCVAVVANVNGYTNLIFFACMQIFAINYLASILYFYFLSICGVGVLPSKWPGFYNE